MSDDIRTIGKRLLREQMFSLAVREIEKHPDVVMYIHDEDDGPAVLAVMRPGNPYLGNAFPNHDHVTPDVLRDSRG